MDTDGYRMFKGFLPGLIQQMLQPEFYPHPVREPIQLIQTHISFVLLTGDFAYKVKKPVNYGFLDYSTLEKRGCFCREEVRLNQRSASKLYLEVLPIYQTDQKFYLSASQASPLDGVAEYTIKMVQFSQEDLFINLFENKQLTEKSLEALGRAVADFHAQALINDEISQFGEPSQIRQAVNSNYLISEPYLGRTQIWEQYQDTKAYTETFFREKEAVFKSRIVNHWIRECHGDLHLKNIAFFEQEVLLFDCIEFNKPFRFVDVMFDIGFVVMDLEARNRPDLSNTFLNTYLEYTGDWEGLQLLKFYLIRQAYVRGNIYSLMLDESTISEAENHQAIQLASRYYQLAWEYTKASQGRLILMSGLSGAGKSTVARYLARKLNAIHIRSDAVRKHLGGIPLHQRGAENLYSEPMTQATYQRLLELGILLSQQGFIVVLDAKYDQQPLRKSVISAAQSHRIPIQILYCTAPIAVLRERLQKRVGDIADARADLLESQQAMSEPFNVDEQVYLLTLDTTKNLEKQLDKVLEFGNNPS